MKKAIRHSALMRTIAMSLLMLCLMSASTSISFGAVGIHVDSHTQDEIRQVFDELEKKHDFEVTYVQKAVTSKQNYNPGKLSDETLQGAVAMLNAMRYIAGIPYDVKTDNHYNQLAQAGAFVNAVSKEMSHKPAKPAAMPDTLYQLGYKGCSSSNLSFGIYDFQEGIAGWIDDITNVKGFDPGHRRWCLNPVMGATGFGMVDDYAAMYVFDESNLAGAAYTGVAWPAQQMPVDYFDEDEAWSVSFGKKLTSANVAVTLTRTKDGKTWNFSERSSDGKFYVSNAGYGQEGCVVFRPKDLDGYRADDVFHVVITENNLVIADYQVNFFELRPVTAITLNKTSLKLEPYDYAKLKAKVSPEDATCDDVLWSSSDKAIVTVNEWGEVHAKREGSAVIYATDSSGRITAACKVDVERPKTMSAVLDRIKLSYYTAVYDGKAKKPKVTIDGLKEGRDYKLKYGKNINVGSGYVKIIGIGEYSQSVRVHFPIVRRPAKTTITNLTSGKDHTVKVTWKKTKYSGYQVRYSTSKSFQTFHTITLKKNKYTSKTITELDKNQTYYIKVRSYRNESDGTKTYSYFSTVKKIKCK